jgi:hypothetical protein
MFAGLQDFLACEIYVLIFWGMFQMEEEARKLQQAAQFKARSAAVLHKKPFEPKKSSRPLTDITEIELNTERRAKEREKFDTRFKLEQAELEELRQLVRINNFIKQDYTSSQFI